ncbi:MAG: hypothetical protein E4H27_09510 [Anaerolineales bacterium]|nr:MAG: hypothetical protein E4H27_09510 [Anaerolineales bacterium]
MHNHSYLDSASLHKIRVWEDQGDIVAVVHYESQVGEIFFQLHPDYSYLKREMLDYGEVHMLGTSKTGVRYIQAFVNDFDEALIRMVTERGY